MPTINDCEKCTQYCPQRQLAREQAEKRMYVTNEFVALQKEIEAGKLVRVVQAYWLWNQLSDTVRCSHCNSLSGVVSSKEAFDDFCSEQHYCYNCGSKMVNPHESSVTLKHIKNDDKHARWIRAECSEKDGNANCSNCGQWDWDDAKYCKGCGSKMWRIDKNG